MDEQVILAHVSSVLAERYGQPDCSLHSLNTRSLEDERIVYKMYRVDIPDHPSWVIFAVHDELMAANTFRWGTDVTPTVWLEQRALLLNALTSQGYPTPHIVLTPSDECVVRFGSWSLLVTTWISGQISQFTPEPLSQAGTLLARLHTLPLSAIPSWPSWWNTTYSIPHAIDALEKVAVSIPPSHRAFYRACHTTLHMFLHALPTLPEVLIHGDPWMQNAVCTAQEVIFIDWESAGCGAALLDLADFLLRSQCDEHGAPPSALNEQHVTAAASGYAEQRIPSKPELDLLADAIRFSVVWRAAWMFARVQVTGWTSRLERGLARVQATYDIADPTAYTACSAFQERSVSIS
jgi:Ser/Thr protein kinase RdoA (MazF antagonist)